MEKTIKDLDIYISDGNYSSKYPRSEEFVELGVPFIRANNLIDGEVADEDMYYISNEKHSVLLKGHVKTGDVLITTRGNIGQVAIVPERHEDSNINAQIVLLRTNPSELYNRYLLWALQSQRVKEQYQSLQTGTALKQLPVGRLEKLKIKTTDISKQHFIADNLDKTFRVIKSRKKELSLLDELIKARFVEMFGDPFSNPKKWRRMAFKEACTRLSDGPFGSNLKSEHYTDSGVRVIRLGNIGIGKFIDKDKSFVSEEHYEKLKKYTCRTGDIVIGTLGEPNLRACMVPEEVGIAINKADCVHYVPKEELLLNEFVCQYINCPETLLLAEGMIHGQTRSRVSSGQIAKMPLFIPPMELQESFAEFVKQVDKSKVAVQKSLDEAQLLFDSLMQEFFG